MKGETLAEAIVRLCVHCKAGHKPKLIRGEWTHQRVLGTGVSITVCGANYVRRYGIAAAAGG